MLCRQEAEHLARIAYEKEEERYLDMEREVTARCFIPLRLRSTPLCDRLYKIYLPSSFTHSITKATTVAKLLCAFPRPSGVLPLAGISRVCAHLLLCELNMAPGLSFPRSLCNNTRHYSGAAAAIALGHPVADFRGGIIGEVYRRNRTDRDRQTN